MEMIRKGKEESQAHQWVASVRAAVEGCRQSSTSEWMGHSAGVTEDSLPHYGFLFDIRTQCCDRRLTLPGAFHPSHRSKVKYQYGTHFRHWMSSFEAVSKPEARNFTRWNVSNGPVVAPNEIERTIIRKLQMRIIPFVFVLYVIAYVDRANIGFASLTMNPELAITSQQYGFIAGIFFFGYFIFEVPSNLLLHKLGARVWLARILVSWGIVAILTGFVQTAFHLSVLRFLLGVAEAGYYPGILLYLTYWFRVQRLAHPIAVLAVGSSVANLFGAPISGVILDRIHWFGLSSWRWMLILEGIPAVAGGILTYFLLPGRPAEAKFLTSKEKNWINAELAHDEQLKLSAGRITAGQALTHGRVWLLTAIYFSANLGNYMMVFWLPQFARNLSAQFSNTTVGLLVMIPYLVALPTIILVGRSSDRRRERRFHATVPLMIGATSLMLLAAVPSGSVFLSVTLWCLVVSGTLSFIGPFWSISNEFLTGFSAAAGIALINCFGNLGGFFGPLAMGAIRQRTGGFRGGLVCAAISVSVSAVLLLALRKKMTREAGEIPVAEASPAAMPTADFEP
jgi:sugar phosphate permease